jgi:membrane protease YdiL (CAAX protease family)
LYELLIIFAIPVLGILSHLAKSHRWLEWVLRTVIVLVAIFEALLSAQVLQAKSTLVYDNYMVIVLAVASLATLLILFVSARRVLSWILTAINLIITLQIFAPLALKHINSVENFRKKRILVPESLPHIIASFVYITTLAYTLLYIKMHSSFLSELLNQKEIQQLISSGGIVFMSSALGGVGICVARSCKEILQRLSLVKPTKTSIILGIFIIIVGFVYDWFWIVYTHNSGGQDIATRLSFYNPETFTVLEGLLPSIFLAVLITLCAGVGEETLFRGALQPVFGILPTALLQGLIHAQIAHTGVFIIQITIWSIFLGLIKRYTNTTTTIIGQAGFNICTILLFASNP